MSELQAIMLEHYKKLIQMFNHQFGESCHAVLYSIYKKGDRYKGHVISSAGFLSSIQTGDPLPDFLRRYIQAYGQVDKLSFLNKSYPNMQLCSSMLFITDELSEIFACLCIHHNLGHLVRITDSLEDSIEMLNSICHNTNNMFTLKTFRAGDVHEFVQNVITEFISANKGETEISLLDTNSKMELLLELREKGIFEVEGAVEIVAERLDLSKFKIFKYLDGLNVNADRAKIQAI